MKVGGNATLRVPGPVWRKHVPPRQDSNPVSHTKYVEHPTLCGENLHGLLGALAKLRKVTIKLRHVRPSVSLSAWNNSAPTGRIFLKPDTLIFLQNVSTIFKFR
jgi:hypothetical protein